jgi:hypothetical protein
MILPSHNLSRPADAEPRYWQPLDDRRLKRRKSKSDESLDFGEDLRRGDFVQPNAEVFSADGPFLLNPG